MLLIQPNSLLDSYKEHLTHDLAGLGAELAETESPTSPGAITEIIAYDSIKASFDTGRFAPSMMTKFGERLIACLAAGIRLGSYKIHEACPKAELRFANYKGPTSRPPTIALENGQPVALFKFYGERTALVIGDKYGDIDLTTGLIAEPITEPIDRMIKHTAKSHTGAKIINLEDIKEALTKLHGDSPGELLRPLRLSALVDPMARTAFNIFFADTRPNTMPSIEQLNYSARTIMKGNLHQISVKEIVSALR